MEVSVLGALVGGLLSFLSPCVLPLVPPYLCYLGGMSVEELAGESGLPRSAYIRVVAASVIFVLGFTTVFVALGATASAVGYSTMTASPHSKPAQAASGRRSAAT